MKKSINVFSYTDYRKLIVDLIAYRKQQKLPFSYRWFSQMAGFSSPNILNLVVKGKRHLSNESAEKVAQIFKLDKDEKQFFKTLVQFQRAKTVSEKEQYAKELLNCKKYQSQYPLSKDQFEYYSDWYNIPVRELFGLKKSGLDVAEISQMVVPAISLNEAQHAVDTLLRLGLLKQVGQQVQLKEDSVTTGNQFANYGVVSFHKKMMGLAADALDRFSAQEREISSVSIGLSEETFVRVKKMIEEFRDQLINLSEDDQQKNKLFQLNFQLFPLSHKIGEPKT